VTESVLGYLSLVVFSSLTLLPANEFLVLLCVCFQVSELHEEFVVHEDLEVFHVVVGFVAALELLLGFSGVYALQNAKSSEVFQSQLKLPNCFGSSQVLGFLTLLTLRYFFTHVIVFSNKL